MNPYLKLAIALVIYVAVGHKILRKAFRNIKNGQVFDENFLMVVATFGALAMGEYLEAISVLVLYRIGEYFQDKAVDKSRQSIAALMDIRPDYANIEDESGELQQVDPDDLEVGSVITIKPGERVPVDGVVLEGDSRLDTAALTGESLPRHVAEGDEIYSGTINLNGLLKVSAILLSTGTEKGIEIDMTKGPEKKRDLSIWKNAEGAKAYRTLIRTSERLLSGNEPIPQELCVSLQEALDELKTALIDGGDAEAAGELLRKIISDVREAL